MRKLSVVIFAFLLFSVGTSFGQIKVQVEFYESNPTVIAYSGSPEAPVGVGFYTIPAFEQDDYFIGSFGGKVDFRTFIDSRDVTPVFSTFEQDPELVVVFGQTQQQGPVSLPGTGPTMVEGSEESFTRTLTGGITRTLAARRGVFDSFEYRFGTFLEAGVAWSKNFQSAELPNGEVITRGYEDGINSYHPVVGTGFILGLGSSFSSHVGYNYVVGQTTDEHHDVQFGIGYRF